MFEVVVSGETVESFNQTDYKMHVSLAAGVPVSCITLEITAGSITVFTTIRPAHDSLWGAQAVKTNLAWNNDTAAATDVLGVTVEKITFAPEVIPNFYAPPSPPPLPPPSSSSEEEDNNVGLVIGLTLGGVALLIAVAVLLVSYCGGCVEEKPEAATLRPPLERAAKAKPPSPVVAAVGNSDSTLPTSFSFKLGGPTKGQYGRVNTHF